LVVAQLGLFPIWVVL